MTKLFITASIALKSFLTRKQEGAAMAEYGLLLFVIAIVVLAEEERGLHQRFGGPPATGVDEVRAPPRSGRAEAAMPASARSSARGRPSSSPTATAPPPPGQGK